MKKQLLLIMMMLLPMLASADDSGKCGDNVTYTYLESTHSLIISGTGNMTNYALYSFAPWYSYRSEIVKVIIEHGVTNIGQWAFYSCSGLTEIEFANSLTSLGSHAFYMCSGLASLTIPNGITRIGSSAFQGCSELSIISIPTSVETIESCAFSECVNLESITLPENMTMISYGLFDGCSRLRNIEIPNGVTKIEAWAFNNCSSLKTLSIPQGVDSIGGRTFYGCSSMDSIILPNSVKHIDKWAFANCTSLQKIIIEDGENELSVESSKYYPPFESCPITEIYLGRRINCSNYLFYKVKSYPSTIIIGKKKTTIERNFLDNVRGYIQTINIPTKIKKIESYAFHLSTQLSYVVIEDSTEPLDCDKGFTFYQCPVDSIYIGRNITFTDDSPFKGNREQLSKVTFGNLVTEITDEEFLGHTGLTSLTLPQSLEKIGEKAFYGCKNIPTISIPSSVKEICSNAFNMCTSVKIFSIDDATEELIFNADNYMGNSPIDSIYLGRNIVCMDDDSPFSMIPTLASLTIGRNVTKIGNGAFALNNKLKNVMSYSELVPETGQYVFTNSYLTDATLKVPYALYDEYKTKEPWSIFGTIQNFEGLYNLTYIIDNEVCKKTIVEQGSAIMPEAAPTKEGHTFSGWSEIPETMPAHDVTVTGTFSINSYKLTYIIDDVLYKTVEYEYGATITPEPQPEGDYQTFKWIDLPQTMPAHDVTVYASYTSGIAEINMSQGNVRIYGLDGKPRKEQQKGLNLVVATDGKTKKVVVK